VGRYKGRIKCWDVVNEALYDSGKMRQSPWYKIIGDDFIAKAFQFAHEADPNCILRYNDYSLENTNKRSGAVALIKKLQAEHVPVTALGMQDHVKMDWPTPEQEDATITAFAHLGLKVMITELDVDVLSGRGQNRTADIQEVARQSGPNLYTNGLPESVQLELAKRYAELFKVFIKHRDSVRLVTFWGVTDADTWLSRPNRLNYPLLFDRQGKPKPAFDALIEAARKP
jgi:endo-1,4-beta-xylanase